MMHKMKKIGYKIIICGLLSLSLGLTGCQQSPDEDIVVNKNEGVLEDAIKNNKEENTKSDVPDTYQDSFEMASKAVTGEIDAKVEAPDINMPVLRVKPRDITVEEVKKWVDILFEGNQAYEPKNIRTKSEIEEEILKFKQAMADEEKFYAEKGDAWDVYENKIAALEKDYETAPDTYVRKETDWTFHNSNYYDIDATEQEANAGEQLYDLNKTMSLYMETEKGVLNGHQGYIMANNRNEDDFKLHNLWFYYKDEMDILDLPESDTSHDEALSMAEDIKAKLGFEDWQLCQDSNGEGDRYFFRFAPVYNGIEAFSPKILSITSEDDYAAKYYYESLEVEITRGKVQAVIWESPVEITAEENDNVATISFEKAIELFKNHVQSEYTDSKLSSMGMSSSDGKIVVNEIRLGMMRIKIKDNSDEFYMVPAWNFKGEAYWDGMAMGIYDLATINAVDGSVIDVGLGY